MRTTDVQELNHQYLRAAQVAARAAPEQAMSVFGLSGDAVAGLQGLPPAALPALAAGFKVMLYRGRFEAPVWQVATGPTPPPPVAAPPVAVDDRYRLNLLYLLVARAAASQAPDQTRLVFGLNAAVIARLTDLTLVAADHLAGARDALLYRARFGSRWWGELLRAAPTDWTLFAERAVLMAAVGER